ncbi:hypothetical protein BDV97DRAFT_378727 [Delphinella strobiligena]|nr:hypothetical protein BDV97DRAFT_378727 [Delphinella strobiligena]
MQSIAESVSVPESEIGLGRSAINEHGQIDLIQSEVLPPPPTPSHTVRDSLNERRHDTAVKVRKLLHISKDSDGKQISTTPILAGPDVLTSDSRLVRDLPEPHKPTIQDMFRDPVATVKSKISGQGNHEAAANIAAKEISHGQEVDLVNAHDRVECAHTDAERLLAVKDLERLIKERQTMYVRWTVDRHVTKCRISPRETFVRKSRSAFESKNIRGETVVDWKAYGIHYGGQYIGYGSDPPEPTKESIMPNLERVIIASAPFQELIMTSRKVYRWEYPAETSKYLIIYSILWYFDLLLPGMLSAVIYMVIHRHFSGDTIEDIRNDIKRTEDIHQTAFSLTEFVEKEGDEVWADKILEQLGPWLMLQLCDMANICEVMRNFYEWRVPSRTWATLTIFFIVILFTIFAPAWLLIKSMTFCMGFTFFGLFPLASKFPDYRLLVSVPRRIFWNIPTHGEWAFQSLQAEGSRYQHATQPSTADPADVDYGHYATHHNKDKGRLIISAKAIRFETNIGHRLIWTLDYDQISNIEKIDRVATKQIPTPSKDTGMDLRIVSKAGHEWVLVNMDERNQAFSQIVGFSNTPWQIVW